MKACDIIKLLDSIFNLEVYKNIDNSLNGLQVGKLEGEVKKVAFAVDANLSTLQAAENFDLLVVHHGLFWSKGELINSYFYDKIKLLIDNNLKLYAVHLPMDAHPIYSHSVNFARLLGLNNILSFGNYKGIKLGVVGSKISSFDEILEKIKSVNSQLLYVKKFKDKVQKIAIVSGLGYSFFEEALKYDIDLFITGDTAHQIYGLAEEHSVNLIFAGHYFTETFGLNKLMQDINHDNDLEVKFIYHNTNL